MMPGLSGISVSPSSVFIIFYLGMQGSFSNLIPSAWKSESGELRSQELFGPFSVVCWSQLALACRNWLCSSLLNSAFSDVMLVAWNWPWWGYLHHGKCKCYQSSPFFFFLIFLESWFTSTSFPFVCLYLNPEDFCQCPLKRHHTSGILSA